MAAFLRKLDFHDVVIEIATTKFDDSTEAIIKITVHDHLNQLFLKTAVAFLTI